MVRGSALAGVTVAISPIVTCLLAGPTGTSRMSAGSRSSVKVRTGKRNWPRRMVPPVAIALALLIAVATSSEVRPSARMRSGSTSTRISSSGSPTTATDATPVSCSRRRACTSSAARATARRSPGPVSASTAIGRSPGSDVSSVGRAAVPGSELRALSSFSRTARTVLAISVPHAKRSVVVPSPFRETDRISTIPGVFPTAFSIGSAMKRETSSGAAPS